MKCFICDSKEIEKVFINTRGVKHYYCKDCAKKYIIKIPKKLTTKEEGDKKWKKN